MQPVEWSLCNPVLHDQLKREYKAAEDLSGHVTRMLANHPSPDSSHRHAQRQALTFHMRALDRLLKYEERAMLQCMKPRL